MGVLKYEEKIKRSFVVATGFLAAFFCFFPAHQANAYAFEGSWISPVRIYPVPMVWGFLSWTEVSATDAGVTVDVRAGDTTVPDGTWTDWTFDFPNGGSLSAFDGKKNLQYRVNLFGNGLEVPGISDVTISTHSGTLISSVYDTRNYGNQVLGFSWVSGVSGYGTVATQVRTSPDNVTWSSWCGNDDGADGCSGNKWLLDHSGGETIDQEVRLGNNDRYFQYRVLFVGDGMTNPAVLGSTNISYSRSVFENTWTSPVKDVSFLGEFHTVSWTENAPSESSTSMKLRAGNTITPDGTWTDWVSASNGGDIGVLTGRRYLQYQAIFSSYDVDNIPSISDVTVSYIIRPSGTFSFLSSPYDSSSNANLFSRIGWNQHLPSQTLIKFQLRTAPDFGGSPDWGNGSKWCGPTTCAATSNDADFASDYYTISSGQVTNSVHYDGVNDRWMQYTAWLSNENSGTTPVLSDVTLTYVVNAPPIIQGVTAVPNADRTVSIAYEAKDPDTTSGSNTPGFVTPSFEYYNGSEWKPISQEALRVEDSQNKSVNEGSFSGYSAVWTPSVDNSDIFLTTAKIRVSISDNEGANNTVSLESAPFTLDTKIPGNLSLVVDASTQNLANSQTASILSIGASDNSTMQMKISLDETFAGVNWEPFSASKTIKLQTDPDTVYAKFKDQYGNETAIIHTQTPETPTRVISQDTSNILITPPEYRSFISFKTIDEPIGGFANYKLYRGEDENTYTLINTITSRTSNFLIDAEVRYDILYYYKMKTTDQSGNVSFFSTPVTLKANGIQDSGEGGGGSDGTPPTIQNIQVTTTDTTTFTATWETDELSNSTVEYGTAPNTYTKQTGSPTYADSESQSGKHSVTVTNLVPDMTYYFRVTSADPQGNVAMNDNGGVGYQVTTNPGPAISSVAIASSFNTQATIVWNTNVPANTIIHYGEHINNGQINDLVTISGSTVLTKNHSIILTGLNQGTVYYFRVTSTDAQGNIANDDNGGNYFQFRTTVDSDPPIFSNLQVPVVSNKDAVITFNTDEGANNKLFYRKKGDVIFEETETTATYDRSHYIVIKNLFPEITYEYKVLINDINQNGVESNLYEFKTLVDPEYAHSPIATISVISDPPHILTDTKAVITFETDQIANCSIEYGTVSNTYNEVPVSEESGKYDKQHSIYLGGLLFSTPYFYHILCQDNLGNMLGSQEKTFTTKVRQVDSGSEVAETVPPTLSNISVTNITGESATVTWNTNEVANSLVNYGLTQDAEETKGDGLVNSSPAKFSTSHSVILRGLVPSTKYYYSVLSYDIVGNIATSSQQTFSTKSPSGISSIKAVSTKIGEVTVTWNTSTETSSIVEYGLNEMYGSQEENKALTKTHEIILNNLSQNTVYHFRVKGRDKSDNLYVSSDSTFEPKSPPAIRSLAVEVTSDREARITFLTDTLTDALVTYQNAQNPEDSHSEGNPMLLQTHSIQLKELVPGSSYNVIVSVRDESGSETRSDQISFTTERDNTPPESQQVRVDSALSQSGKVQMIVSWITNEPATSQILYREGKGGDEKTLSVSALLAKTHTAILTGLKSGTMYTYRLKNRDESGNELISKEFITMTPQVKENVIELIVKNFNDIFGWIQR